MAFSPDGNTVYLEMYADNRIAVVDVARARELYLKDLKVKTFSTFEPEWIEGNKYPLNRIKISPDGRELVSCDITGTVKIWDTQSRKEEISLDLKSAYAPNYPTSLGLNANSPLFVRTSIDQASIELVGQPDRGRW